MSSSLPIRPTNARRLAVLVLGGLLILGNRPASAQRTSTGQNGTGQNGGTGMGSGAGGQGVDTSGVGGNGAGGNGGGLDAPAFRQFGADVDTTDGTGFAGRGNTAENFVGGTVQQDQATGIGGRGFGQNNPFSAINRQGQFNRNIQPTGPSRSERIRPRHRIAFTQPPRQAESISTTLQTRLGALPSPVTGVDVTLNTDGVATLRGTAATSHQARLAAALARLEPGVRSVENQITVSGD